MIQVRPVLATFLFTSFTGNTVTANNTGASTERDSAPDRWTAIPKTGRTSIINSTGDGHGQRPASALCGDGRSQSNTPPGLFGRWCSGL